MEKYCNFIPVKIRKPPSLTQHVRVGVNEVSLPEKHAIVCLKLLFSVYITCITNGFDAVL